TVIETIVGYGNDPAREHLRRIGREIDPAFLQGNETFGRVEADPHDIKCTYIIGRRQSLRVDDNFGQPHVLRGFVAPSCSTLSGGRPRRKIVSPWRSTARSSSSSVISGPSSGSTHGLRRLESPDE